MKKVTIYTDGACSGNPGPGGWGALLCYGPHEKAMSGAVANTTNNRMELQAAIEALSRLKRRCRIDLYTDSQYLRGGVTQWMDAWKERNWRTADKTPVANRDQWEILDRLREAHDINWYWVKAHAGHPGNERADDLARRAIKRSQR